MSGVTVGPLAPEDLPRAAEIQATAPEAWSLPALEEELASPCGRLFGLWREGRLEGTAVFQLILDEASLLNLTLEPECRGRGLGRRLLEDSLSLLKSQGAAFCYLEVRSQNQPALGLYRRLGFEETGRRRGFYQSPPDDALLMRLSFPGGTPADRL